MIPLFLRLLIKIPLFIGGIPCISPFQKGRVFGVRDGPGIEDRGILVPSIFLDP